MKTLITYGTKHGTTCKCATLLANKLTGQVDLHDLKDGPITGLEGYDKVIIGGSIYGGTIVKEVNAFCSENLNRLKGKKIGLFICGINKKEAAAILKNAFPEELQAVALARESFGGELRFSKMNFFERFITKMVSKSDPELSAKGFKDDISMIAEGNIESFAKAMNAV